MEIVVTNCENCYVQWIGITCSVLKAEKSFSDNKEFENIIFRNSKKNNCVKLNYNKWSFFYLRTKLATVRLVTTFCQWPYVISNIVAHFDTSLYTVINPTKISFLIRRTDGIFPVLILVTIIIKYLYTPSFASFIIKWVFLTI